ncbi:DNA-binding protein [Streptomyces ipomoeae]|nr:DNA-binding protein [Streptomyces ipomoeae]MDX2937245.1 DNA-binding protein [Streptomyces ipomoeae]
MGRRERPVDPNEGPVQSFAYALRKLRREAGGPTYREMARRAHYSVTALSQAAAGEQLPSLAVTLAYVRVCGGDPGEWERRWRSASEAAEERRPPDDSGRSPYQGLARFEPDDHERFFGRDELIDRLRRLVGERRFTAVFGASGSGKSSLLRAGLIPALRAEGGGGTGASLAAIRVLTPGERPLRTHAEALKPKGREAEEKRAEGAGGGSEGDTVIVVDQFEEVFTLCHDPAERAEFIDRLLAAREEGSRLRVVIAVRADFYGRCGEHRALAEALSESGLLVGPMGPEQLRAAVVGPAQSAGLIVERELTARLVAEVEGEPGGLPLMSHVLHETWRRRRGRALTAEAYEAAGGLHGAIAQTAEEVYTSLSAPQAALARSILLRLITPGEGSQDTRRPVPRTELDFMETLGVPARSAAPDHPDDVALVLDRLVRARLVTADAGTVDLAHEALISAWPRLRGWIEEDRERLRTHRRLTEAAQAWDELGREPGALYRGTRLDTAVELFAGPERQGELTSLEGAFLAAGRAARRGERRRRRGLAGSLAVLVVLALVAGAVAWQQGRTSERRQAEAEARRIAALADSMRYSDPVRAMRLSVAAWRLAETTETRSALLGAVTQREEDTFAVPGAETGDTGSSSTTGRHLVEDGRTLVSVATDRITTWDVRTHRRTHSYPGLGELSETGEVDVRPDGRQLALASYNEDSVRLWDLRTGRVTATLPTGPTESAWFGPSGHSLVVRTAADEADGGPVAVQVWDTRTHRTLARVPVSAEESVQATAVSPDDRWLALCTDTRPLEIWSLSGRPGQRQDRPLPWPSGAGARPSCSEGAPPFTFAPDNRTLAIGTETGIRRVDFRSGQEATEIEENELGWFRFSADGRFLAATGPSRFLLWRLSDPETPVFAHPLPDDMLPGFDTFDFELDFAEHTLRYLNISQTVVRSLDLGSALDARWEERPVDGAASSQDGTALAVRRNTGPAAGYRILDLRRGDALPTTPLPGKPCPMLQDDMEDGIAGCADLMAFSGDGRFFAYGTGWDGRSAETPERQRVTVWDVAARRERTVLDLPIGDGEALQGIALSHDGALLLAFRTMAGDAFDVWDVRTRKRVDRLPREVDSGHGFEAASGSFGSETQLLAVSPDTRTIVSPEGAVADRRTGRVERRALGDDMTSAMAFSPDGSRLAVGDLNGHVTLWNGTVSRRVGSFSGTSPTVYTNTADSVTALAFSADGRTLAVGGDSGSVQLWDVASNRPLGSPLLTPGGPVLALAFDANNGSLYVSGRHQPTQRYDLTPAHLADQACERAGGGLTREDWKTYLPDLRYRETC